MRSCATGPAALSTVPQREHLLRQTKWKYRNFCIYRTREAYAHSFRLLPLGILGSVSPRISDES